MERLARWCKSPILTDPGLKWGTYYHFHDHKYYCQVIPRCQDSCCTGEGGFPGPKRSTHHRPSKVGGSCSKLERLIQQELKYLGLIWLQHRAPLYIFFLRQSAYSVEEWYCSTHTETESSPVTLDKLRPVSLTSIFANITEGFVLRWVINDLYHVIGHRQFSNVPGVSIHHYLTSFVHYLHL